MIKSNASAYSKVGVEAKVHGADAHRLIEIIFEEIIKKLTSAIYMIENSNYSSKGQLLGESITLIGSGLQSSLNLEQGGEISINLNSLYLYCVKLLTEANVENDSSKVAEVLNIISGLKQSWSEIK